MHQIKLKNRYIKKIYMKFRKLVFGGLFLLKFSNVVVAQWEKAIYNIPVTIPPAPTSAALGKFGSWPVSYYTGVPQINIPLYEIKSGAISTSVSLSYHASGIAVEEMGSWTGLGWSLNCGGVITRTVNGYPDENPEGYLNILSRYKGSGLSSSFDVTNNTADLSKLSLMADGAYDSEPDAFCFNFNDRSGKFFLNANNEFIASSFNQLKIVRNPITNNPPSTNTPWEIIDEKGNTYIFGDVQGKETSFVQDASDGMHLYYRLGSITTAWYLNRIISQDKRDTIFFKYTDKNEVYTKKGQQIFRIPQTNTPNVNLSDYGYGYKEYSSDLFRSTGTCQLTSVEWKFGKIELKALTNRLDIAGKLLDSIAVLNSTGSLLKAFSFNYNYSNLRLFLNKVNFYGTGNEKISDYQLEYNSGIPVCTSNSQDFWGFYNGAANANLISYEPVFDQFQMWMSTLGTPNANRETSNSNVIAGAIKKIIYPTGGYTLFEFEANDYYKMGDGFSPNVTYSSNPKAGGIRVKSIKDYNSSGALAEERSFAYQSGTNSTGVLFSKPKFASVNYQQFYNGCIGSNGYGHVFIATSTPYSIVALGNTQGSPVGYSYVFERFSGGNNGINEYNYSNFNDEWNDVNFDGFYNSFDRPPFLQSTSNDYKRGLLLNKKTFAFNGTTHIKVSETINTYDYNDNIGGRFYQDLKVLKVKKIGDSLLSCMLIPPNWNENFRKYCFAYGFYKLKSVWVKLNATEEKSYDLSGTTYTSIVKNYFYDNLNHINTTKIEQLDSKNQVGKTEYLYAHEMVAAGLDPNSTYQRMINKNMINVVVEQKNTTNTIMTERIRKNYSDIWYPDNMIVAPQNIEVQVATGTTEQRLIYHSYDNAGNATQVSKSGDVNVSYIYDYKSSYPVAEAKNAAISSIAHTSFEADGKGNWTFSGTPAADATAPTGKKAYTLGNSITKSGLSTTATYIVSYWKKSGTVAVNGTTPVSGKTINGWTYYEHTVTNPAGGLITVSGTSGVIDELRLYPAKAQMTTYTYEPLVGMTSQCDAGNRITYYEYDSFGRLKTIRDQDKNVIKTLDYQYQKPNNQ